MSRFVPALLNPSLRCFARAPPYNPAMPKTLLCLALLVLLTQGCSTSADYYRLDQWGEGWKLDVKEERDRFTARWVKGDNRSVQLVNYDDSRDTITVINTLYLELAKDGSVVSGRLKRIVASSLDRRTYEESHAKWFGVLSGNCVLDATGKGHLDVTCQGGYRLKGEVIPADNLKVIKPEQP